MCIEQKYFILNTLNLMLLLNNSIYNFNILKQKLTTYYIYSINLICCFNLNFRFCVTMFISTVKIKLFI